jgi:hypothetical protein
MAGVDVQRLRALGLLSTNAGRAAGETTLQVLCAAGALEGGLSVALDVRSDELLGPLCQRMGDAARRLRVVEVRTAPPELWVRVEEKEMKWPVPAVPSLVRALNRFYRGAPAVRAVADLGVWEDGHQLWCLSKQVLPTLLHEGLLEAENWKELSALVEN